MADRFLLLWGKGHSCKNTFLQKNHFLLYHQVFVPHSQLESWILQLFPRLSAASDTSLAMQLHRLQSL